METKCEDLLVDFINISFTCIQLALEKRYFFIQIIFLLFSEVKASFSFNVKDGRVGSVFTFRFVN